MELILNLAWGFLALGSVCLWAQVERRKGAERRFPAIALLMLIVILFPIISVSDDLWSIQNPAETDTLQRRDQLNSPPHSIFPALAALCEPVVAEMRFGFLNSSPPVISEIRAFTAPVPVRLLNRPPPAA
jgi:nitrate reductase NapE component